MLAFKLPQDSINEAVVSLDLVGLHFILKFIDV